MHDLFPLTQKLQYEWEKVKKFQHVIIVTFYVKSILKSSGPIGPLPVQIELKKDVYKSMVIVQIFFPTFTDIFRYVFNAPTPITSSKPIHSFLRFLVGKIVIFLYISIGIFYLIVSHLE